MGQGEVYYEKAVKPVLHSFMGAVFEEMCRYYTLLKGITGEYGCFITSVGTWWGVENIADKNGNIKRLNNYNIRLSIEGEGRLLGGAEILANPAPVKWGTAPVLVQSTLKPGKIRITASVLFEGSQKPVSGELELESKQPAFPLVYDAADAARIPLGSVSAGQTATFKTDAEREVELLRKELNALKLKEVERQQSEFGEKE